MDRRLLGVRGWKKSPGWPGKAWAEWEVGRAESGWDWMENRPGSRWEGVEGGMIFY